MSGVTVNDDRCTDVAASDRSCQFGTAAAWRLTEGVLPDGGELAEVGLLADFLLLIPSLPASLLPRACWSFRRPACRRSYSSPCRPGSSSCASSFFFIFSFLAGKALKHQDVLLEAAIAVRFLDYCFFTG